MFVRSIVWSYIDVEYLVLLGTVFLFYNLDVYIFLTKIQ